MSLRPENMKIISSKRAWLISIIFLSLALGITTARYFNSNKDIVSIIPTKRSPFHSIEVRNGMIVATLHPRPTWLISEGGLEPRHSKPEESFTLHPGSVIRLSEKHSSYEITAQITPEAGLTVNATFDGRSLGDDVAKITYFIPAK